MTNTWPCKGGRWINMSMPGFMLPRYWAKFCTALGLPKLIDDARFNTVKAQLQPGRCAELTALIEPVFMAKELAEWCEIFEAAGCESIAVYQLINYPHSRDFSEYMYLQ